MADPAQHAEYERVHQGVPHYERCDSTRCICWVDGYKLGRLHGQQDVVSGGAVQGGHGSLPDASGSGSPKDSLLRSALEQQEAALIERDRCGSDGSQP